MCTATGFAVGPVPLRGSDRRLIPVGGLDLGVAVGWVRLRLDWGPSVLFCGSLCRGSGQLPERRGAEVGFGYRFSCGVSGSRAGSERRPALAQTSTLGASGTVRLPVLGSGARADEYRRPLAGWLPSFWCSVHLVVLARGCAGFDGQLLEPGMGLVWLWMLPLVPIASFPQPRRAGYSGPRRWGVPPSHGWVRLLWSTALCLLRAGWARLLLSTALRLMGMRGRVPVLLLGAYVSDLGHLAHAFPCALPTQPSSCPMARRGCGS